MLKSSPRAISHTNSSRRKRTRRPNRAWIRRNIGLESLEDRHLLAGFASLNLTPGVPDIESAFIDVAYVGNNTSGTLTASGFAQVLTPPGSPSGNIVGGTFDINATINHDAETASGTLDIGGTIAGLGFNSGTLLTGTFSSTVASPSFGTGAGDPLEFLFTVTGGDAATLYGSTAGVILSQSGFTGSFNSDFASAPFGGLADTFGFDPVPIPSLNLTPGSPDIESAFITVDYVGNNAGGLLTASGFAQVLTPPGSPAGNIAGGSFDISANINANAGTATGTLNVGGTIAGLGFNSGTLLTGTFSSTTASPSFGAGPGDPLEFLFTVTGGDAAGLFGSTAGVILSQSGFTGSFNSSFASAPFAGLANTFGFGTDLEVIQIDATDPVTVGDNVTYTVGVNNTGPLSASNVVLTDTLPAGVTFVSATPNQGTCSESGGIVTCSVGTMGNGASVNAVIVVTTTAPGTLTNTASVTSDTLDPNSANDSATEQTTVDPVPIPSLNLTPGSPDIESAFITVDYVGNNAGGVLTASGFAQALTPPGSPAGNISGGSFDISANINANAGTATGTLNVGGTIASQGFNSGTLLTGTFSSTTASPSFGAGPGDPLEFLFTVTGGDAAGLFGSTAGVILSQSGFTGSFNSNFASAPFAGLADTFGFGADLGVTKNDAADPVVVGDNVTYTVAVGNAGPNSASNVVLTDTLPAGVTFVSATPDQGTCSESGGTITCNLGTVANSASVDTVIVVTTTAVGTLTNAASVTSDTADPNGANDSVTEQTTVVLAAPFPSLNLTPGSPDIESSFITVDYVGNNAGAILTASGFAQVLTPPGSPAGNISGGTFDISANINAIAETANGTLTIGGTVASLGFNSGTLLTGTFSSTTASQTFGAGAGDPLEFLFTVTGGDAGPLFGSTARVILSQSGFAGNFGSNFTSGPFQALANTSGVDAIPPEVTINQAVAQADPVNTSPINYTVVFNEPVFAFATGDVTLGGTAGATTGTVTEISPNDGTTYNVAVSGMTGDGTVIATVGAGVASDAAGNSNNASTSTDNQVTYDTTAPTVAIDQAVAQDDPTNASPINFTVVFSESVSDFATGDVSLAGTAGATTATVTGSGTTYNVSVSGMIGDGTVIAAVGAGVATDDAGNSNNASTSTDNQVTYDVTAPTLLAFARNTPPGSPTNADTLIFDITFDEVVNNVTAGDFVINGTTAAGVVGGSGSAYTLTVSGGDLAGLNGTVGLDLAGGQDIEDTAGNALPAGEPAIDDTYDLVNITAAPEFLVNDSTGGFQVTYAETRSVAANAAGDLVITFAGSGPGDTQGIFARRYDATNTPLGGTFLVNVTTSGNQRYPSAAVGAGGESVIAWSGKGVGDSDGGVYARLYDNTGAATSGEIKVSETTPSDQHRPVAAKASDGSFIITWSGKGVGDTSGGIFARRFAANGAPLTSEFRVNTTTSLSQQEPDVVIASDGSFVFTWSGNGPGDPSGVFFQRYSTAGSPVGAETRVNTTLGGQQKLPSIGIDGANNFTIVWNGMGAGDSRGVFLQRFNASGNPVGGEELVNTTTLYDQEDASISVPPSGAAVVTWTSLYQDGSQRGVFAQEFSAAGAKVGSEILVSTTTFLDQKFSSVAARGESAYTVVWSGRGAGDTTGVFAATFLRMPVPLVAEGSASGSTAATLAGVDLESVLDEATDRWIATGLSQTEIAVLNAIQIQVFDLDAGTLGGNIGADVFLDIDAAGLGWFVDATPAGDSEFSLVTAATERVANESSDAYGRVDLLTVVMHELGHAIGKAHADAPDLMGDALATSTRRLPTGGQAVAVVPSLSVPSAAVIDRSHYYTSSEYEYTDVDRTDLQNAGDYQVLIPPVPRVDDADEQELEDYYASIEDEQASERIDDELLDLLAG